MPREREGYIESRVIDIDGQAETRLYVRMQYRDASGKPCTARRRVSTEAEGRKLLKKLKKQYEETGGRGVAADAMTFRALAQEYKERRLIPAVYHGDEANQRKVAGLRSWKSPQRFLETLVANFGGRRVRDITHADVETFKLARLRQPTLRGTQRAIASVNRELEIMRAVMRYAARQGYILRSPFETGAPLISKADETRRERVLTHAEETRLLEACTGRRTHLHGLLVCAIDTGMRRGELLKLRWGDVDFTFREIVITALNSKTARARHVAMTARVYENLRRLQAQAPPDESVLVFGITDTFKRGFASACRAASITGLRFHDLRHTAITRMIQAGVAPMEVMKISGHTQMTTFTRYVNPHTDSRRRAADALAAFNAVSVERDKASNDAASEMIN